METLTQNAQVRLSNIGYTISALSLAGSIGGVIYSHKTGGGFWRGVGYFIVGGILVGGAAKLVMLPFENKIIKEGATVTA